MTLILALSTACEIRASTPPIRVGLIAPLSGNSGASGIAIQRGMQLAADEINRAGGVLNRPIEIVAVDVQNDPDAGRAALQTLVERDGVVAVFGGIFSPVMLAQIDDIHRLQVPLINPWGSMTDITENGQSPNFAFRVSVSDRYADEFLVRYAAEVIGARRPAILADTTAWGEANTVGLLEWLGRLGISPAGVARFDQGETNVSDRLVQLQAAEADALLLVANAPEGAAVMRGLATLGWRPPVISHWGVSGGDFAQAAGFENVEGVLTLQTYSFMGPLSPLGERVVEAYHARFGTRSVQEIEAPVGVAHGYDGMHLLALAIERAGSAEGPAIQAALEQLGSYDGLVKHYERPFTSENHDALQAEDYLMAIWRHGRLVPASGSRLPK